MVMIPSISVIRGNVTIGFSDREKYFQKVENIVKLCVHKAGHLRCFSPAVRTTP